MQLTSLLLLTLPITVLAFPSTTKSLISISNSNSTFTLSKRWTYGWIGSFDDDDAQCKRPTGQDGTNGDRPILKKGKCVVFPPQTSRVGLDWGAGKLGFSTLTAFASDDCTYENAKVKNIRKTAGDCFLLDGLGCTRNPDKGNPCFWRSVMAS